jgi:hypothetical protein
VRRFFWGACHFIRFTEKIPKGAEAEFFTTSALGWVCEISPALAKVSETRYIPAKVKRIVCHRDKGRCMHVDGDGKRCESKHALQYEHIIPFAKGGKTSLENLKLSFAPLITNLPRFRLMGS